MNPHKLQQFAQLVTDTDPKNEAILALIEEVRRLERQVENWEAACEPYRAAARMVHTAANVVDSTGSDDARIAEAVRIYLLPLVDAEPSPLQSLPLETFERLPAPSTKTIMDAMERGREAANEWHKATRGGWSRR